MAASWTVAFDRLAADHPPALQVLTIVAWVGPEPVPLTLFTDVPDALPPQLGLLGDPLGLAEALGFVRRRGMATLTPHTVQLHRVPAALLGARTVNDHPDIGGWATAVLRLLHTFPPADPWNDPATWPRWQELLPHVLAAVDPTRPADPACRELKVLLDIAASYRARRGEYRDALALSHQAGALSQAQLGDDHPYTLMSANSVAVWLGELGEHEQARALAEDILTRRRRVLGKDHPITRKTGEILQRLNRSHPTPS